jgi:hypothetical protein
MEAAASSGRKLGSDLPPGQKNRPERASLLKKIHISLEEILNLGANLQKNTDTQYFSEKNFLGFFTIFTDLFSKCSFLAVLIG